MSLKFLEKSVATEINSCAISVLSLGHDKLCQRRSWVCLRERGAQIASMIRDSPKKETCKMLIKCPLMPIAQH